MLSKKGDVLTFCLRVDDPEPAELLLARLIESIEKGQRYWGCVVTAAVEGDVVEQLTAAQAALVKHVARPKPPEKKPKA